MVNYCGEALVLVLLLVLPQLVHPIYILRLRHQGAWVIYPIIGGLSLSFLVFKRLGVIVNYAAGLISLMVVCVLGVYIVLLFCCYSCGFSKVHFNDTPMVLAGPFSSSGTSIFTLRVLIYKSKYKYSTSKFSTPRVSMSNSTTTGIVMNNHLTPEIVMPKYVSILAMVLALPSSTTMETSPSMVLAVSSLATGFGYRS